MAQRTALKPWHEVVELRDDLKTGELSLSIFAADLYDVVMQRGLRPVYRRPGPVLRPDISYVSTSENSSGKSACAWLGGLTGHTGRFQSTTAVARPTPSLLCGTS